MITDFLFFFLKLYFLFVVGVNTPIPFKNFSMNLVTRQVYFEYFTSMWKYKKGENKILNDAHAVSVPVEIEDQTLGKTSFIK